jgi:hypothetical protein
MSIRPSAHSSNPINSGTATSPMIGKLNRLVQFDILLSRHTKFEIDIPLKATFLALKNISTPAKNTRVKVKY